MTTYHGERSERLARSLEATMSQTRPLDQIVVVLDGPVDQGQEDVIARYTDLCVVRLPANVGLAAALNAGLVHCTGTWIMRMDSDDYSLPDRTELQLAYAVAHPEIDLIGTWAEEFVETAPTTRIKSSAIGHEAIVQALKWRNVLVHPSIMVRASVLRAVGGFRSTFALLEDWDLFVRLALRGSRFAVIPKVLVRVRAGREQAARRGGLRYTYHEVRFRTFCWRRGFINHRQYAASTIAYMVFRLAGPTVRGLLYRTVRTQGVSVSGSVSSP